MCRGVSCSTIDGVWSRLFTGRILLRVLAAQVLGGAGSSQHGRDCAHIGWVATLVKRQVMFVLRVGQCERNRNFLVRTSPFQAKASPFSRVKALFELLGEPPSGLDV